MSGMPSYISAPSFYLFLPDPNCWNFVVLLTFQDPTAWLSFLRTRTQGFWLHWDRPLGPTTGTD